MIALIIQQHDQQKGLQFVIGNHSGKVDSPRLARLLRKLELLLYETFDVHVVIQFESPDHSLELQAADIFAKTLLKLPEEQWPLRVIVPVKYETLAMNALFKTIMHMKV
ncbi:hypothetical protein [Lacticaseibacillus porcinae]|uniref:hypothetical protein n=1 Tax=Lacticaseibacillus porcinae TaxID=1123687 RepID=UPI000F76C603|nr:hypothetical protein [Lacticaseibacillus porcinae]